MLALDARSVEALGCAQLSIDVDDEPAAGVSALCQHEIEGQLASELDETVVAGLCDDENILNVALDAGATWRRRKDRGAVRRKRGGDKPRQNTYRAPCSSRERW